MQNIEIENEIISFITDSVNKLFVNIIYFIGLGFLLDD